MTTLGLVGVEFLLRIWYLPLILTFMVSSRPIIGVLLP